VKDEGGSPTVGSAADVGVDERLCIRNPRKEVLTCRAAATDGGEGDGGPFVWIGELHAASVPGEGEGSGRHEGKDTKCVAECRVEGDGHTVEARGARPAVRLNLYRFQWLGEDSE
jgi:hypothetical protein